MTIKNDASLRGKCKALAAKHGIMAQEAMQMYFFECFLMRLEKSKYAENFVLKGGLLIASLIGVANRTTMDMDATLKSITLNEEQVASMMKEICSISCNDSVMFVYEYAEPIRDDDAYGGLRAHIRARFGRMDTPMKIDLTTGDIITPRAVEYPFNRMFDDGTIQIMSYPITTCIAEKFESIVKRGILTTRAKDLYDIERFVALYDVTINWDEVRQAISNTAKHRDSLKQMKDYERVCEEMQASSDIQSMWANYAAHNTFASEITLLDTLNAVRIVGSHYLDEQ